MRNISSDVSMWLSNLSRQAGPTISLFTLEYKCLSKLAPIEVVKVMKTPNGEPRLYFIDRLATITLLKDLYAFHSKEDATKELHLES